MEVKCKPKKFLYSDSVTRYKVVSCEPIQPYPNDLKLNSYSNFTLSGRNLDFIELYKDYTLEIEEDTKSKYDASYVVCGYPGIIANPETGRIEVDETLEQLFLKRLMTGGQAQSVNSAYPHFAEMILNGEEDQLDYKKIYGVGPVYIKKYIEKVKSSYNFVTFLGVAREWGITTDAKIQLMIDHYITLEQAKKAMQEEPYFVLMEICDYTFETADRKILEKIPEMIDSPIRCTFACVKILRDNEKEGDTRINANILAKIVKGLAPEAIHHIKNCVIKSPLIYYDLTTKNVSLQETYEYETKIAEEIVNRVKNPIKYDMDWENFKVLDDITITDEQAEILRLANEESVMLLRGNAGCVDCDTEFFNGSEWKPIKDYAVGDKVLQYNEDGTTSLVEPSEYIKKPCSVLYQLTTKTGLNQAVCSSHRIVYWDENGAKQECKIRDIIRDYKESKWKGKFKVGTFENNTIVLDKMLGLEPESNPEIKLIQTKDGFKYCFTVPSHMLVLRRNGCIFVTGNSGKSATTKALIQMLEAYDKTYTLLAPTGIAAKRLKSATGRYAQTIHMFLALKETCTTDFLIIDEISIAGIEILAKLFYSVVKDVKIIFIGDEAQLASISCGNVLQDIITSGIVPTANLTKIFRYGIGGIATVSTDIRNGKMYLNEDGETNFQAKEQDYNFFNISTNVEKTLVQIESAYEKFLNQGYKISDILVLSPFNKGDLGTYNINRRLQEKFNPHEYIEGPVNKIGKELIEFKIGDKVVNIKNNYRMTAVDYGDSNEPSLCMMEVPIMNGDIGFIRAYVEDQNWGNYLVIQFEDKLVAFCQDDIQNLLLGYGLSIHKVQGAQAKVVIMLISNLHKNMLTRNLLYVGASRAQENLFQIGDVNAIEYALSIEENKIRDTWLKHLLVDMLNKNENKEQGANIK